MSLVNPETIDLSLLPSVGLFDVGTLPKVPALYFVLGANDAVRYIGRATSLRARWKAHHRFVDFARQPESRVVWMTVGDAALLPLIEQACLVYFHPELNSPPASLDARGYRSITLRLPVNTLEAFQRHAVKAKRSLNAQILYVLEEWDTKEKSRDSRRSRET